MAKANQNAVRRFSVIWDSRKNWVKLFCQRKVRQEKTHGQAIEQR